MTGVRLSGPLAVDVTPLLAVAQQRAASWPIYRHSMRERAGNEVGALGEVVALQYLSSLPVDVTDVGKVGHDLLVAGRRVEVKTKERRVAPQPHYDCSVPEYVRKAQTPDVYLFVSLLSDGSRGMARFKRAWVLGTISHTAFWNTATRWTPDMCDTRNNWTATIPVYNIPINTLTPPLTP